MINNNSVKTFIDKTAAEILKSKPVNSHFFLKKHRYKIDESKVPIDIIERIKKTEIKNKKTNSYNKGTWNNIDIVRPIKKAETKKTEIKNKKTNFYIKGCVRKIDESKVPIDIRSKVKRISQNI